MRCSLCEHYFCWHCLASLDDDPMYRHYDSGECQGRLGYTRFQLFVHRTWVTWCLATLNLPAPIRFLALRIIPKLLFWIVVGIIHLAALLILLSIK